MVIRFNSKEIGATGRTTSGMKGISLKPEDYVVSALAIRHETDELAIFSETGLGKRTALSEFPTQKRAGKGVTGYKQNVSCATLVEATDNVLICGDKTSICIEASQISSMGRAAAGNMVIKDNKILSVSKV